jgi:putative MATE family efflux protein
VTPLWTLLVSTVIGLIFTPAFIAGWFGLPKLGVASAAVASLISLVLAMIWLGSYLLRRNHPLAPDAALLRRLRLDWSVLKTVLMIGVPTGVQMVIMAVAELVLLGLANSYGSDATAAYGAINQVLAYVQFPAMSIGIAASILGAQAIGAGRTSQLWAITRTALILNFIITGAGVLTVYLLSHQIVAMFITEPQVIDLTQHLLHIVLWSAVVFGMAVVFSAMMRSSGTVLAPTAIGIFSILAVEVPVALYLSGAIGIDGVWWAYPAAFTAMFVLQGSFYTFVWRKRSIRALV